jgi:hypothetical protein
MKKLNSKLRLKFIKKNKNKLTKKKRSIYKQKGGIAIYDIFAKYKKKYKEEEEINVNLIRDELDLEVSELNDVYITNEQMIKFFCDLISRHKKLVTLDTGYILSMITAIDDMSRKLDMIRYFFKLLNEVAKNGKFNYLNIDFQINEKQFYPTDENVIEAIDEHLIGAIREHNRVVYSEIKSLFLNFLKSNCNILRTLILNIWTRKFIVGPEHFLMNLCNYINNSHIQEDLSLPTSSIEHFHLISTVLDMEDNTIIANHLLNGNTILKTLEISEFSPSSNPLFNPTGDNSIFEVLREDPPPKLKTLILTSEDININYLCNVLNENSIITELTLNNTHLQTDSDIYRNNNLYNLLSLPKLQRINLGGYGAFVVYFDVKKLIEAILRFKKTLPIIHLNRLEPDAIGIYLLALLKKCRPDITVILSNDNDNVDYDDIRQKIVSNLEKIDKEVSNALSFSTGRNHLLSKEIINLVTCINLENASNLSNVNIDDVFAACNIPKKIQTIIKKGYIKNYFNINNMDIDSLDIFLNKSDEDKGDFLKNLESNHQIMKIPGADYYKYLISDSYSEENTFDPQKVINYFNTIPQNTGYMNVEKEEEEEEPEQNTNSTKCKKSKKGKRCTISG